MPRMQWIPRRPEPEYMDDALEVAAYDEADFTEVNRALAERIVAAAGPAGRAIDLGTGPASIPVELCALAPGWRVVAIDASARMLARARERLATAGFRGRVELLRVDVREVESALAARRHRGGRRGAGARRRFDLVLSNSLLHHLPDPIAFWRTVARLAHPGGVIAVQDLLRPGSDGAAARLVARHAAGASPLLRDLFHRSLLAAYTSREVEEQLRLARVRGLRVERVSDRHLLVHGRKK